MKVLIVDDSKLLLTALKGLLTSNGYEVCTASNGREGLEVLEATGVRAVISDWEMPEMDGIQFCEEVRKRDNNGYIYFLLLTSHGQTNELVQGLNAGADDFITKPYQPSEVLARLRAGERILSLETRDVVLFGLAKLAERRDNDTGKHLERVQNYSQILASHLSTTEKYKNLISREFIRLIYLTSPMHDIGKVGIPDNILLKNGRLDAHEFEIMKTHPTIGAETFNEMLAQFPNVPYLTVARDIALSHHEKWDGTGYPGCKSGEDIPLCGRIVAVADVYDALISKRVYKEAMSHNAARTIIEESSGTHFDPDVVEAFCQQESAFLETKERFAE